MTVSYTHLDVYKRQDIVFDMLVLRQHIIPQKGSLIFEEINFFENATKSQC